MQFAVSQDRIDQGLVAGPDHAGAPAPSRQRVSTTATLVAMVVCVVAAKGHLLETQAPSPPRAAAQNSVAAPAKIIAPEFCKDQTWPYIDSRCLRRVDDPAAPAAEPRVVTPPPPTSTAAVTPAPAPVGGDGVATSPESTARTATADANPVQAAAPAAGATDARTQVIESVFPTPPSGAAAESGAQSSTVNSATTMTEARPRHRSQHWGYRSNVFGYRY